MLLLLCTSVPLVMCSRSIASPICQEGQRERTFPIFPIFPNFSWFSPSFSRFLAIFLLSRGAPCPLDPPVNYATGSMCCDQFDFGSSQITRDLVDLVMEDYAIKLSWQIILAKAYPHSFSLPSKDQNAILYWKLQISAAHIHTRTASCFRKVCSRHNY